MSQNMQLTACDISTSRDLLNKIKDDASKIKHKIETLQERIESGELDTKNGIAFLDVKNQLLTQYNLDIVNLVRRKVSGESIENNSSVDRLIQMRTYIERIRPIEKKLKYQIEKLIKIAAAGGLSSDDPLHLKPNPNNMVSKLPGEDEADMSESEEDDDKAAKKDSSAVYRPPMMSAAHYEEEYTRKEREQANLMKAKKRAINTAMMRELRTEYSEAPEEIRDDLNLHRFKQSKEDKHRTEYEEENYRRVALTKEDKKRQRQLQTIGTLDSITKFGDITALTLGKSEGNKTKSKGTRKHKMGGKKKRKSRM